MDPLAHTFSIVARDPNTRQFGVGVQSHWFASGAVVPWAEKGVGAVATQAMADLSYGRLGLALMRAGKSASQALAALTTADDQSDIRQVAMVDSAGRVAVHTGARCISYTCSTTGDGYSVQANLMQNPGVCRAMAQAFESAKGDFSERLMQALEAGQDAGGDVRGRQSAGLLVVPGPDDPVSDAAITNLRVDDSDEPLMELRRLLTIQRGYEWHTRAIYAVETGDMAAAREYFRKLRGLIVGTREPHFWYAVTLAEHGHVEDALPIFRDVFTVEPIWRDLIDRFVESGDFPNNEEIIKQVKAL